MKTTKKEKALFEKVQDFANGKGDSINFNREEWETIIELLLKLSYAIAARFSFPKKKK